jgi:uridine kinase
MRIIHINEINKAALTGKDFLLQSTADYDRKCERVARHIAGHLGDRPIILLAGPSGSGKTTTALKLEENLRKRGLRTHTVSLDNYFLPKERISTFHESGEIDYESPYRIDIELLQEHMRRLADCKPVDVPTFDFKTQSRGESKPLVRREGELILFEGIHALNPEVTGYDSFASCVYVSVRTRIQLESGELFHPELIRLMRRIIRDRNFRGRSAEETADMFDSVQRGESLYINPFKQRAHYELDTFHDCEVCVYKSFLESDFARLAADGRYDRFSLCAQLLSQASSLDSGGLPEYSMMREFIGGSGYTY